MLAVPGQAVKAGDLLVQLDSGEIQARLDQATAVRDQFGRETERLRRLLADSTVSLQEFEATESRYQVAAAAVAEAATLLLQTRIVAPFDGVVARKFADVGDLASPGRALLEMDDPRSLRLEADVPQALIDHVQPGASMRVRAGSSTNDLTGTVSEIAPAAEESSRTFLVKLDLPADAGLRPGQFGRVAVPIGESIALRVPVVAVLQRGQMEIVFVVDNQRAQLRLVKTGKQVGAEIELLSGVTAGEQVVTSNPAGLRDGQPVEILP
jgi:RND family efflux transporter MFP subunit